MTVEDWIMILVFVTSCAVVGVICYILGRHNERVDWNKLIEKGKPPTQGWNKYYGPD